MKISIVVPLFPPERIGGTEIATLNIAKHLSKKHEIHVFTRLDEGFPRKSYTDGFYVHRIPWSNIRFFGGLFFWINLIRILKQINPHIIHAQTTEIGKYVFLVNKLLKKPYVVWARGSDVYSLSKDKKNWLLKLSLENADALITLTENMKNNIKRICDREIIVIPNGVDLKHFEDVPKKNLTKIIGLKKDEKIILYVGNIRPIKGLKYLVMAMKLINNKNIKLLLLGRGSDRRRLEEIAKKLKIEKLVTFIGRVPNKEVFEYMAASEVFVLPSLSEGFPNVILEAMASGLPIVTTNIGGLPEIINHKENGFLVNPKKPEQIAEKISILLKDENLRKKISRNNKLKAKKYSWERVTEDLEEVYFKLIDNKLNTIKT